MRTETVILLSMLAAGAASNCFADPSSLSGIDTSGIATPTSQSICDMPSQRGTAIYNKYCAVAPSVALPKAVPVNPAANMMNQMGQQMIMNGIQSLFQTDQKTPEQIEADRQAEILRQQQLEAIARQHQEEEAAKRAQEEADHQKMKSEMKLTGSTDSDDGLKRSDASPQMAPAGAGDDIKRHTDEEEKKDNPQKHTDAFNKGYEHGSGCFSQNSMSACGGVSNDLVEACLADYRRGYQVGEKRQKLALAEATRAGRHAGAAGETDNGAADERADGPCRTQWVEAYSQGYFEGKASIHP